MLCYINVMNFLHLLVALLVIAVCRYNFDLNYKRDSFFLFLKVVFNILYTKLCLSLFSYATSTFVFLQIEAGSDKNILELSNEVLLSETKNKSCKHQSHRALSFVKKPNTYSPSI